MKTKAQWVVALLILLGAWALYLQRLDAQDIWWDEARNIEVATRPLTRIAGAPELDIHPPLVTLRWQADGPTARPLKVSLRLRDEGGAMLAQDDRVLLNDRHLRTTSWQPGETALAVYNLALPPEPGTYSLTLVLYDEESLEPVGLRDGSGVEPEIGTLRAEP